MKRYPVFVAVLLGLSLITGCKSVDFDEVSFGMEVPVGTLANTYEIRYDGSVYVASPGTDAVKIGKMEREVLRDISEKVNDLSDATLEYSQTSLPASPDLFIAIQTGDQIDTIRWGADSSSVDIAPQEAKELMHLLHNSVQL